MQSSEAFVLPAAAARLCREKRSVARAAVHGLCALVWARPAFQLDLTDRRDALEPDDLVVLARALRPTVTSLLLDNCDVANGG